MNNSSQITKAAIALLCLFQLQNASGAPQLEEVIVTAQKREQSAQDVPVSMAAFNCTSSKHFGIMTA